LLPLSGPGELAVLAKAMKQAAELALFEHDNPGLQLLVKDDKGTPEGARAAAEGALRQGAEIVLGPLLASSVDAVRPISAAAGKSVIAFSNDKRVAGRGVHLLSHIPDHDVERIVTFAAARGHRRFAALVPNDDYGRIVETALARSVADAGGRLVATERYVSNGTGMLGPARRLSAILQEAPGAGDDRLALLLPGAAEQLASLGPLLTYTGLDGERIRLLGTSGWDQADFGRDKAFVGALYPAPDKAGWNRFSAKFASTFGSNPPRLASLAFDAMGVAIALAADRSERRFTSAAIMRPEGFKGVDGALRFLPDGTARRTLAIHEVQAIGTTVVDQPTGPTQTGRLAKAAAASL
jgi:ABC-type branched-subunit amino acid transport system substrate-binding protein